MEQNNRETDVDWLALAVLAVFVYAVALCTSFYFKF